MMDNLESLSPNQRFALNVCIPLVYFLALMVAWVAPKYFGFGFRPLVYIGLSSGLTGLLLWFLAMFYLGNSLNVLPSLPGRHKVVTSGIYKYLRHPLYVGITLRLFGLFLACGSLAGMIYLFIIVIPLNLLRARLEEKALARQFGQTYLIYKKRTLF